MLTHGKALPLIAAAAIVLSAAVPLIAHNPVDGEFTCPICRKSHIATFLGPWPFYATMGGLGIGPELRSWSYMGPGDYWMMACPHCGYCNAMQNFHVIYMDSAVTASNPHRLPSPPATAEKKTTETKKERKKRKKETADLEPHYRNYLRLNAAKPLDFPAIQRALTESVDPKTFRYVNAYVPERIDIMLRTVGGLSPAERWSLALTAAWSCDDFGETRRGVDFRARAIREGFELVKDFPPGTSPYGQATVRYRIAEMQLTVGRARKDAALRAEGRDGMKHLIRMIPQMKQRCEQRIKELEGRTEQLNKQIRQRVEQIGGEATGGLFEGEGLFEGGVYTDREDDPVITRLRKEIERLEYGDDAAEPDDGSAGKDKQAPTVGLNQLEEDVAVFPELRQRARAELAADAMRDLTRTEALAAARKGTSLDKEGFLKVHGHRLGEPEVRRFVRDLLTPLHPHWKKASDQGWYRGRGWRQGGGLFEEEWEEDPPKPPREEVVLFDRYVTAISHSHNEQREDFIRSDLVEKLLPKHATMEIPPPSAVRRLDFDDAPSDTVTLTVVPGNAAAIARGLTMLDDEPLKAGFFPRRWFGGPKEADGLADETGAGLFDEDVEPLLTPLSRTDAPWAARILLDDLRRRPHVHLKMRFDCPCGWDRNERTAEDRETCSAHTIARHAGAQACRQAEAGLADLGKADASPFRAAAALIPLEYVAGAKSRAILHRAARGQHTPVRLIAVECLLRRGDPAGMDALLDEAIRRKRVPLLANRIPTHSTGELIQLLDKEDLPKLRTMWYGDAAKGMGDPATPKPPRQPSLFEDEDAPAEQLPVRRNPTPEDCWVLAAMAHLGDTRALREYNAWLFKVETRVGDRNDFVQGGPGARMYHTPVSARCARLQRTLNAARDVYCTEAAAAELLDGVKLLPHFWTSWGQDLLIALAGNPATHEHYRKVAANLAGRPVPLPVKHTLMRYCATIPVPEVTAAARRWAQHVDPSLAREAREAIRKLNGAPKRRPGPTSSAP